MAETSGPWAGDTFAEGEWRQLFGYSQLDGILRRDGEANDGLAPTFSQSNRDVTFSPGWASVRGTLYHSDAPIIINVPEPSPGTQRIDYVVLRYDPSQIVLDDRIKLVLVQGQESANPSAPSLTQDHGGIWEWPRIRIGPFGTGAIAGASSRFMGTAIEPVTWGGSANPNDRLPGLSTVQDALTVDSDGKIWVYRVGAGEYIPLGKPQTGTIAPANGWEHFPNATARWWKNADGLVVLRGIFRRSGSSIQVPENFGAGALLISGSLPSEIRPGSPDRDFGLDWIALANIRLGTVSGAERHSTVRIDPDGNFRLRVVSANDGNNIFFRQGDSWVSLAGISWWTD